MERIEGYKIALSEQLSKEQMYLMVALAETPEVITYPGIASEPEEERAVTIARWIRVNERGGTRPISYPKEIFKWTPKLMDNIKKVRERYENS